MIFKTFTDADVHFCSYSIFLSTRLGLGYCYFLTILHLIFKNLNILAFVFILICLVGVRQRELKF